MELTNAAPADPEASSSQTSFSSAPSSSSQVAVSLADIMEQLQHMRADFGNRLDDLSDKMCQINTKISRIARHQSQLGGFASSPSLEHAKESSSSNGGNDDGDASGSEYDDEMMTS